MTNNDWACAMCGQGERHVMFNGEVTRVRYIVADAIDRRASVRQKEGRPDKASLLRYVSGQVRHGSHPSKKSVTKAQSDLEAVRKEIVDGVPFDGPMR